MAHEVASREGLLVGISAGAAIAAALDVAARPEMKGKRIVTIACDGGERYMSLPFFLDSLRHYAGGLRRPRRAPRRGASGGRP